MSRYCGIKIPDRRQQYGANHMAAKRKLPFRITRLGYLVLGLFSVLTLILAVDVYFNERGTANGYGCLSYLNNALEGGVIDLQTGVHLGQPIRIEQYISHNTSTDQSTVSPDRKSIAGSVYSEVAHGSRLLVRSVLSMRSRSVSANYIDSDSIPADFFAWSPDSRQLAYYWWGPTDRNPSLAIADANRHQKLLTTIDALADNAVTFHGWSADGVYLAVSMLNTITNQRQLLIWTASDLRMVRSDWHQRIAPSDADSSNYFLHKDMAWSPQGHWLAYLVSEAADKYKFVITAPGKTHDLSFDLSGSLYDTRIMWAPDGRHIAVVVKQNLDDYGLYQLDLFGLDGSAHLKIIEGIVPFYVYASGGSNQIWVDWSADGRSLLYVQGKQNQPNTPDLNGDFRAYRIDDARDEMLIPDLMLNLDYTPDHRYAIVVWDENGKAQRGIIDTQNGRRYRVGPTRNAADVYVNSFGLLAWSDKSQWMLVGDYGNDTGVWAVNVQTGEQRQVIDHWPNVAGPYLSPDGEIVAFARDKQLHLVALDQRWAQRTLALDQTNDFNNLYWLPNSAALVVAYQKWADYSAPMILQLLTLDGTEIRRFEQFPPEYRNLQALPCG